MPRTLILTALVASLVSALTAFAVAALVFAPSGHAAPAEQGAPPVLQAQRFELVDANGAVLARLGVESDGRQGLSVLDPTGQVRTSIGLAPNGSSTVVLRDFQSPRLGLSTNVDGSAALIILDQGGQPRVGAIVEGNGAPSFQIRDDAGQRIWQAP